MGKGRHIRWWGHPGSLVLKKGGREGAVSRHEVGKKTGGGKTERGKRDLYQRKERKVWRRGLWDSRRKVPWGTDWGRPLKTKTK